MVSLTSQGTQLRQQAHADAERLSSARAHDALRHRFSLGGIALEMLPERDFPWTLPDETTRHTTAMSSTHGAILAAVTCSLRVDKSLEASATLPASSSAAPVVWEKTLDGICVHSSQVVVDIAAIGARRYVASARIADPLLLTLLLNTLVTSVAELAGGLCLHATAVALAASDSGAVLLLGPSGAGKTTAAQLLGPDVTCLSNDRVTLVPDPVAAGSYWVWSLPVGKAPELERCSQVCLPLTALLRVRQAREPRVTALREVEALLQIRQAVEIGAGSEFFEAQRLAAVGALAAAAKSGVADVLLARSWRTQLDSFLEVPATAPVGSASLQNAAHHVDRVDGAKP